ncbi:MAG: RecQ family ATP-dependent DNA helicase [Gammaproteobacteria bacterium]|nr:RecQ family ATP-dependent DNA helicase [Gammaproteobacteria bacterium]
MNEIEHHLQQTFGFKSLRSGQKKVIQTLIDGHSAAAIFPTGSGKSLCYQLPALILPHLTLVISPLLALMKDQIDFLKSHNISAASIDSSQTRDESNKVKENVRNGQIKILMISVERLKNERFREFIKQIPISLMVIDEAHCISEWGHNFRPDYIKLPVYQKEFNIPQVLLLTATATTHVIQDMSQEFNISSRHIISTGFYRNNLNLLVYPCKENNKLNLLAQYLKKHSGEATIVYVTLQKTAEEISQRLNNNQISAEAYHAGLKNDVRQKIQERFMNSDDQCIVATIAFGMGIDKNNIRNIIHYDLPKSIENYAQEIGRAGRDGLPSNCLLLGNLNGLNVLENFVYGDTPELTGIENVLQEIKKSHQQTPGVWEILESPLSAQSNIRLLALKTLVVYLEIEGIIKAKYSYFAEYKFKLLITKEELLQQFKDERQTFVQAILDNSQQAKIWATLNFEQLQNNYQTDRQRVITALEYFQEKGWIDLESKQMTHVYKILNDQFDLQTLSNQLFQKFKHKEQSQIQRLNEMLALFQSPNCLSQQLSYYFADQQLTNLCGHCSACQGEYQAWPQKQTQAPISTDELQTRISTLNQAVLEHFGVKASIELMCRYLCGITAPWLTKIKARKLGHFGRYEDYAYEQILSSLRELTKNNKIKK